MSKLKRVLLSIFSLVFVGTLLPGCLEMSGGNSPNNNNSGSGGNLNGGGDGSGGGSPGTAAAYFSATVLPAFRSSCASCHNDPRFGGNGPLTIFDYSSMVTKVIAGGGADQNTAVATVAKAAMTNLPAMWSKFGGEWKSLSEG